MVKSICVDDKNRPIDFPRKEKWVQQKRKYNIIRVLFIEKSKTLGVELNEIDLEDCSPYLYFKLNRFAIAEEDLESFHSLVKACKEEQDIDTELVFDEVNILKKQL